MIDIGVRPFPIALVAAVAIALTGCTAAADGDAAGSSADASGPSAPMPSTAELPETEAAPTERVVQLAPGTRNEASGIVASTANPGAYFLIDDDLDDVVAVASDGSVLASIAVDGMSGPQAEAISGASCGSTPPPGGSSATTCLYIGGIGDNLSERDDVVVVRIAEPDLANPPSAPVPSEEWHYTYPDGAQDAEAMMVDADGSVVIVTKPEKGQSPTRIYRGAPGGGELTFVRDFEPPRPVIPLRTLFTGNVAVDAAAEPGRVLLLTYDELYEYLAPDPTADLTSFPDWPHRRLPMPSLPQPEGVDGDADGCGYVVASEAGPGGDSGSLAFVTCG